MTTEISTIVNDFVSNLETAIRAQALAHVNAALGSLNGKRMAVEGKTPKNGKPARAKPVATKALSQARALQGKYLGALRTATGKRRVQAKAIAKKDGVPAAIKFLGKKG